jgi:hypothetical protein
MAEDSRQLSARTRPITIRPLWWGGGARSEQCEQRRGGGAVWYYYKV